MNGLIDIISPELRKKLYAAFGALVLVLGAIAVGFSTAGLEQPMAVKVATAVLFFLGAPLGFTAAANTLTGPSALRELDGPLTDEFETPEAPRFLDDEKD